MDDASSKKLRRCDRNRRRSKRRAIFCPTHGCYLDSTSPKHTLYADRAEHLQQRGMGRKISLLVIKEHTTVPLEGEWLEAFWCPACQNITWFHVKKLDNSQYQLLTPPADLWQQAVGVIDPKGNPTVGDFTRRQARALSGRQVKDFHLM